jgi:hypothetical protein
LLALGSGSKKQRCRGALLPLTAGGTLGRTVRAVDASPLFARLGREFNDLNLEGGWVHGDKLYLLQRGNTSNSANAVVVLPWEKFVGELLGANLLANVSPQQIKTFKLGLVDGVPLSFTDASCLPDGSWVYSAVAEDSADAISDGPFVGTVIGLVTSDMKTLWQKAVHPQYKIEGIDAQRVRGRLQLLGVTDADDPLQPAVLLRAVVAT